MNRGAHICHELAVNSLESCAKIIVKNASEKRCLIQFDSCTALNPKNRRINAVLQNKGCTKTKIFDTSVDVGHRGVDNKMAAWRHQDFNVTPFCT